MNIIKYLTTIVSLAFAINAFSQTLSSSAENARSDRSNYVVKFYEPGLLYYTGGVNNIESTSPQHNNSNTFEARSEATKAYGAHLNSLKQSKLTVITNAIGTNFKTIYHYKAMYHGLMLSLTSQEVSALKNLAEIKSVEKEPVYDLVTESGPKWINADQIWDGTAVPFTGLPNKGEGIVVGVVDTGINSDHPSYAATGPDDGYVHTNPLGSGNFVGHCIGGNNDGLPAPNAEITCNNKLIGAWAFTNGTDTDAPEDNNGHGSHTAGTAAGNFWSGPFFDGGTQMAINLPQISGVAPHANIIAYDVCETSTCSATSAGIDRAIQDGVNVINFSISGGNSPWFDNDRQFLDAVNAGIFVAASAGNTRAENTNPIADVNHKGPWLMTVAASTHDRNGNRELVNMSGGTSPPADIAGQSNTEGYGPALVVYAGDFSNGDADPEQCLNPFPNNTWTNGEIVVCDRGAIARVAKGVNVLAGGAGGLILGNIAGGATTEVADFHVLPSIHMNAAKADQVRAWLTTGSNHMATIVNTGSGAGTVGDILADFSLRGPNLTIDVTKPNITAPGVSIFAPFNNDPNTPIGSAELGNISGTSMSSPHMAGVGALMKAVQPTWTVSEINSAIQMTADETGRKEDNVTPVDPDDLGSGRVDLSVAAQAGLVMDETFANYLAANPSTGGDPKTLNIPSVRNSTCGASCNWSRTLKDTLGIETRWTVSAVTDGTFTLNVQPTSFVINEVAVPPNPDVIFKNGFDEPLVIVPVTNQTLTITASNVPTTATGMSFGKVVLTEINGLSPPLHITVSANQSLPYGGTPPPDS